MPRTIAARGILGTVLTAALLIIAFPQIEWSALAWVALVPLLLIIDGKSYKAAFGWSYLCGFIFFSGTLGWFVYVTYPGAFLLIAYLSLYFALFGLAVKYAATLPLGRRLFFLPSVWVVLEFVRAHLISGFGWVMLGHTQYKNLLLAQIADITGVYGVSFLVMLVNVLIVESIHCAVKKTGEDRKIYKAQAVVIMILIAVLAYGYTRVVNFSKYPTVNVGVVQPNIAQAIKWDQQLQPWIVQKTVQLTQGFKKAKLDLIVWPETSLPGVMSEVPYLVGAIKLAAKSLHTPILMGAITDEKGTYYNSAYLIDASGAIDGRYDKIHLVPFGEYLPLRPVLGWVNRFVPLEDFTPGKNYAIFKAAHDKSFGVLICFEDTVSYLHRNFANAGAGFLVNMTNDAWFMDTKAPFIHLQAAVFGSIENKRSLVRAANTGFSGFIDPLGRVIAAVEDGHHKMTFVSGIAAAQIPVVTEKTFYTKYGDAFTLICLFGILGVTLLRRFFF